MIVDAFLYAGETDMLELRMRTLAPVVDLFVPVCCTRTHQGELIEWPLQPIPGVHGVPTPTIPYLVSVGPLPAGERGGVGSAYYQRIERQHRDGILLACGELNVPGNALVLVSDVDEIPDPEAVGTFWDLGCLWEPHVFAQRFHSTALNLLHPQQPWLGTTASLMENLAPQQMRNDRGPMYGAGHVIGRGGWHLSWFGTDAERARKLDTFSHAELRGRWDPVEARFLRTHSNGEHLALMSESEVLPSLPAPIRDGSFAVPDHWWA